MSSPGWSTVRQHRHRLGAIDGTWRGLERDLSVAFFFWSIRWPGEISSSRPLRIVFLLEHQMARRNLEFETSP
ncbi:hypothetical protein Tco_1117065 [Tanacetum coccineum]